MAFNSYKNYPKKRVAIFTEDDGSTLEVNMDSVLYGQLKEIIKLQKREFRKKPSK